MPTSWTQTGIYSLANIIYGAPFASKQFNTEGNGKPIIRIRDLKDQQFATYTTEVHPKGYLLHPGDIVVGMDGEFRPYIWGNDEAWLNQRVCVFENKRPNGKAFLYFTIKPLLFAIEQTQVATTVIHIGKKDFEEVYLLWVSKEDPAVGGDRQRGVIDGLFSCGKEPTEVIETSFFYEDAVHNVEKLTEKLKKPAALICATDRIAQGAYKVLYEKEIAIPDEVSVVGFGDYETGELMRPPLTTVKFDWRNWGESSAETMLQMIQQKPVSTIQVNPYEFIERKSVR